MSRRGKTLLGVVAGGIAIVWAARQAPLVALAFHAACLIAWIGGGAWWHFRRQATASPLLRLLVTLTPLALAVSLGRQLFPQASGFAAGSAAVAACASVVVLAFLLNARLARLPILAHEAEPMTDSAPPNTPPPTWTNLPNGLRYRSQCVGEIGMGGPPVNMHYFSNGIELGDGDLHLSASGRYALCTGARHFSQFVLADLEQGRLRRDFSADEQQAMAADLRHPERLAPFLADARSAQLRRVGELWVEPELDLPLDEIVLPDPLGRERLHLRRRFDPAALHAAAEPLRYLREADYAVFLDDAELPLTTRVPEQIVWDASGDMLLVPGADGRHSTAGPGTHWLWRRHGPCGWASPRCWDSAACLPSGGMLAVSAIDRDGYWLDIYMNYPSHRAYPQRSLALRFPEAHALGGPSEWIVGADERGRLRIRELDGAEPRLRVRLAWSSEVPAGLVESTTATGSLARFHPIPAERRNGLLPYRVEAGAASADAVQLFHLWSDCGRYLALQAHPGRGQAADGFFVLDVVSGRRLDTPFRGAGLQLIAWQEGELQVAAVAGCVDSIHYSFDPFAATRPPPPPEPDGSLRHEWLLCESQRFRVDPARMELEGPLPKLVHLTQPPYPNAAFDFQYQAPGERRSVYVFGARNDYQDNYDRAQCCRYQARAITSDGICLAGLGVGMIWSDDGRYLVVTTRVAPDHPGYDDLAWQLRLLDCQERRLYPGYPLGCMPILESLAGERLAYRRVDVDWWRDDVETTPASLHLDILRRGSPRPLICRGGLCLLPEEETQEQRWQEVYLRVFGCKQA